MLHSTRSKEEITVTKAILKGLASDGGLFIFDEYPHIDIKRLASLSYKEIAFIIFKSLFSEFTDSELLWAIDNSYNDDNFHPDIITIKDFDRYAFLELFNGPTAAFKDFALTILPNFMMLSKKKNSINSLTRIVVATSGDTGSATLSGFLNKDGFKVTVLYPNNLVSDLQEKQMLYYSRGENMAYAYDGNFDDCQRVAKDLALLDKSISSANSINIGRLVPQIFYYFYGYISLVKNNKIKLNDKINVSVPTGNFGNILACYLAKKMGVPINTIICASNSNNVLYDVINKGIYDRNREFIKTYSPSMDILVSSNLERMLYLYYKDTNIINKKFNEFKKTGIMILDEYKEIFNGFYSNYTTNTEIKNEIKDELKRHNYILDPHTSVALNCYNKYYNDTHDNTYTLIVSTASPYKFNSVYKEIGLELDFDNAPRAIKRLDSLVKEKEVLNKDLSIDEILKRC